MLRQFALKDFDGAYQEGAFCLLEHKEYNQNPNFEMVMVDTHHGLVLSEFERNGYNDSDFYAVVWDVVNKCPQQIQYATTRAWTYDCGCVVDATPEIKELYRQWQKKHDQIWDDYKQECSFYVPKKGMTARSKTTKGKAKGLLGEITWIGNSNYSRSKCVRITNKQGYSAYVDVDRIELWHPKKEIWVNCATYSNALAIWVVSAKDVTSPARVTL